MNDLASFQRRRDAWLLQTGMKVSRAAFRRALPFLPNYYLPGGFDHTCVFYSPKQYLHVLITEPYHTAREALASLDHMAINHYKGEQEYSWCIGKDGAGLWYPGHCFTLLVAREGHDAFLEWAADLLPTE